MKNLQKKIEFKKKGYVIFRNVFDKETCKNCLNDIKNSNSLPFINAKRNGHAVFEKQGEKKYLKYFKKIHLYLDSFNNLLSSKVLNLAKYLLGQNVYYYNMGLHNKLPGNKLETPPHQDNFYWCRSPNEALTIYIALTNQSKKNGGIGYLTGSHKGVLYNHTKSKVAAFSSFIDDENIIKKQYEYPNLKSGDVVFHHCNIIHLAAGNLSKTKDKKSVAITIYGEKTKLDKKILKKYKKNLLNLK